MKQKLAALLSRHSAILVAAVLLSASAALAQTPVSGSVENSKPELLSFSELVALSSTAHPQGALEEHLDQLLATPFVNNDAAAAGVLPHRPAVGHAGPSLRAGFWNIERGLNFAQIRGALLGPDEFARAAQLRSGLSPDRLAQIHLQLLALSSADVLILNEVDLGMKRTEYRNVARELASALQMNYAFGVEFVEVDPVFDLGTTTIHLADPQEDARLQQDLQADPARYRGLHGNAILSRYPIRSVRIFRLPVCHDWYRQEAKPLSSLERAKRWSAVKFFRERVDREVRHGGRMALIADLAVPESPTGIVTVVNVHLENKCPPGCRQRQMDALLDILRQNPNPVILAGDLNTTNRDNTPTSLRNEIARRVVDYRFWAKQAVSHFHPLGMFQYALMPAHLFHGYMDPTALHLPILWENHERGLFKKVRRFRFADGSSFDFSGVADLSANRRGRTLADTNERAFKGFVPTYAFERDYWGAGRFKLDWFFVKACKSSAGPEAAPRFGVTMRELNESVAGRISDHPPLLVDLPLQGASGASSSLR